MQDAGRLQPQKPNTAADKPADTAAVKAARDAAEKPGLKVTFERPETRDALKAAEKTADKASAKAADTPARDASSPPEPAPPRSYSSEPAPMTDGKSAGALTLLDTPEENKDTGARASSDTPTTAQLLRAPLLAIVAVFSLLAAGWSYTKLNETRMQLETATQALSTAAADKAAATEAKTVAEKALADAQSRLAKVEKAVADIKAALSTVAAGAAAGTSTEPGLADAPRK